MLSWILGKYMEKKPRKKLKLKGLNIETLCPKPIDPILERMRIVRILNSKKGWISR